MDEIILSTSGEAAKYVKNIEGWVSSKGLFFGKDEAAARYNGSTHKPCSRCGAPARHPYSLCEACREVVAIAQYYKLEEKYWDRVTPLYSRVADTFFRDIDELEDYCSEVAPADDLQLVICDPVFMSQIGSDYWCDDLAEDQEVPDEILNAVEELNELIRSQPPIGWQPGKYRANLSLVETSCSQ